MKKQVIFTVCVLSAIIVFAKEFWYEDKRDWTPLMCAIYYNQTDLRDSLIQAGGDVNNASNWCGLTAMEIAIRKQDFGSVKVLLETDRIADIDEHLLTACIGQNANTNIHIN